MFLCSKEGIPALGKWIKVIPTMTVYIAGCATWTVIVEENRYA
jgi:hypothetical protein